MKSFIVCEQKSREALRASAGERADPVNDQTAHESQKYI